MLTNTDLRKIGQVVDERLKEELAPLKSDVKYLIETNRASIDINKHAFDSHEHRITRLEEKVFPNRPFKE